MHAHVIFHCLTNTMTRLSEPSAAEDPQIAAADRAYIAAALATAAAAASQNKSPESMPSLPATASSTFGRRSARHSGRQSPTGSVYSLRTIPEEQARVAIYDATNSTLERRELIRERCALHGVVTIFIESVCSDQRLITESIQEVGCAGGAREMCERTTWSFTVPW